MKNFFTALLVAPILFYRRHIFAAFAAGVPLHAHMFAICH